MKQTACFKNWNPIRSLTLKGEQYIVEIWQNSQKKEIMAMCSKNEIDIKVP